VRRQPDLISPPSNTYPFNSQGPCRNIVCVLSLFGVLALAPAVALGADDKKKAETPKAQQARSGSLVILGGGALPDTVRDQFLDLAGGKKAKLVVIPTASVNAGLKKTGTGSCEFWKEQPVESVVLMHTMDRDKANEAGFVKPLTEATGVWLGGGDQSRLIDAYHGTAVQKELHKVLARGGVVGGTSAGASAMSSLMIVSGNPEAKTGTGFGLIDDVVIDQHFHNRNRLKRLQGILTKHTNYWGLGIDEATAVVVKGSTATVVGNANVRVCLPTTVRKQEHVQVLKAGDRIDLDALRQAVVQSAPK